jgi:LmbE family N-acetylglucosaminyl deacetylase
LNRKFASTHLYFSPHLDDVVISCGGLIAAQVAQGGRAFVITVFAGYPRPGALSPFARHLHAKWGVHDAEAVMRRREEDEQACRLLGATAEHWAFLEAPYRRDGSGGFAYCSYEALQAPPEPEEKLCERIRLAVLWRVSREIERHRELVLYFPAGLASHIDHRLLAIVGRRMRKAGIQVRAYAEWPYAEILPPDFSPDGSSWAAEKFPIPLQRKIRAAACYETQLGGWGGSQRRLAARLRRFALREGQGRPAERLWRLGEEGARTGTATSPISLPGASKSVQAPSYRGFLRCLRWHDLGDILPPGGGLCLDVGCGEGRHQSQIENAGYRWLGIDLLIRKGVRGRRMQGAAQRLPIPARAVSGVVLWQVLEYVEQPEAVIAEVSRVLRPGGMFCGSVSFLEPQHGLSLFGLSPLLLERMLRRQSFDDIAITPGLIGFALQIWTFLRRMAKGRLAFLALPLTHLWLVPLSAFWYACSWLWRRIGLGSGQGMQWLCRRAPLEFAGHVLFVARKAGGGKYAHCLPEH